MNDDEAAGPSTPGAFSGIRRHLPRTRPGAADTLLAVGLAYVCAWNPPTLLESPTGAGLRAAMFDSGAYAIILAVCCVAIALRRLAPTAAVAAIGVALTVHVLIFDGLSILAVVACLVAAETCTSRVPRPRAWILLVAGYVGAATGSLRAGHLIEPPTPASGLIIVVVAWAFVTVAALTGLLRRRSRERVEHALERAELLAAQQETEWRLAVVAERQRIARDVHDLLGHSLSVIGMQAAGARAVLEADPDAAGRALAVIGQTSRDAVDEVRGLVDVLRADGEVPDAAQPADCPPTSPGPWPAPVPAPGLDDMAHLVAGARRAGLPVTLELYLDGDVPEPVDEAVYRCVQEALTNVLRHAAGAPTVVRLCVQAESVEVVVENLAPASAASEAAESAGTDRDGPGPNPRRGVGLVAMRERLAAVGGFLQAGPRLEGGWRVHVVVPAAGREAQDSEGAA